MVLLLLNLCIGAHAIELGDLCCSVLSSAQRFKPHTLLLQRVSLLSRGLLQRGEQEGEYGYLVVS